MRKLLSIAALGILSLCAWAQGGIPLLDRVKGHRVSFHYTYSLSRDGAAFQPITDGQVCVEGNAYRMEGLGLEVISNGSTRWTLDRAAKEVVIENVVKEDLFTNPALFIASYREHLDQLQVNDSGSDFLDVTLTLDEGTRARFLLKGIVFGSPEGKSDFSLDEKSLASDFVVTDLR